MSETKSIKQSMNQNKSLIEAARLKKKAEQDDIEIKRQVEQIKQETLHRGSSNGGLGFGGGTIGNTQGDQTFGWYNNVYLPKEILKLEVD